jgi:glycine/D-amino acid oxidase-like deaminating enzyme
VIGDAVAFDATSRELIMGIAQKHSSTSRRVRADKLLLAAGPWTSTVAESLRISR